MIRNKIENLLEEKQDERNNIMEYNENPNVSHETILRKLQTEINLLKDILEIYDDIEDDRWNYECPECGMVSDLTLHNFCPRCGNDLRHKKSQLVADEVIDIELEAFEIISEKVEKEEEEDNE